MAAPTFKLEHSDKARIELTREESEFLETIADMLSPRDKALVRAVYTHGVNPNMLAMAAGVCNTNLYGRVRRVVRRIKAPEARVVWDIRRMIPPDARKVVIAHMIAGRTLSDLQKETGHSAAWLSETVAVYRDFARQRATGGEAA